MGSGLVRLHRWDEIALEKVTEMLSRKIVSGEREMLVQIYVKRGCLVPMHAHESEQMTYVLQGAIKFLVGGRYLRAGLLQPDPPGLAGDDRRVRSPLAAGH
jgi:anti-sigma factor ChrR (cupin superfamily)